MLARHVYAQLFTVIFLSACSQGYGVDRNVLTEDGFSNSGDSNGSNGDSTSGNNGESTSGNNGESTSGNVGGDNGGSSNGSGSCPSASTLHWGYSSPWVADGCSIDHPGQMKYIRSAFCETEADSIVIDSCCSTLSKEPLEKFEPSNDCQSSGSAYEWYTQDIAGACVSNSANRNYSNQIAGCRLVSSHGSVDNSNCSGIARPVLSQWTVPDSSCGGPSSGACNAVENLLDSTFQSPYDHSHTVGVMAGYYYFMLANATNIFYSPLVFNGSLLGLASSTWTYQTEHSLNSTPVNPNFFGTSNGTGPHTLYLQKTVEWTGRAFRILGLAELIHSNWIGDVEHYWADTNDLKGDAYSLETDAWWTSPINADVNVCGSSESPANCSRSSSALKVTFKKRGSGNETYSNGSSTTDHSDVAQKILFDEMIQDSSGSCRVRLYTVSPLILDISGRGVKTMNPFATRTFFDLEGTHTKERISCAQSSAFLALPDNGAINDIHQLFGHLTRGPDNLPAENGFETLKKYDSNGDLVIDEKDGVFDELRLWQDVNCDGIAQANELMPLSTFNITKIDLNYIKMYEADMWGNETKQRSVFYEGNLPFKIFDVWFADQKL